MPWLGCYGVVGADGAIYVGGRGLHRRDFSAHLAILFQVGGIHQHDEIGRRVGQGQFACLTASVDTIERDRHIVAESRRIDWMGEDDGLHVRVFAVDGLRTERMCWPPAMRIGVRAVSAGRLNWLIGMCRMGWLAG